jgi:cell division protein FtsB
VQAQGLESNTARDTAEKDAREQLYYIVLSETFFGFI